MRGRAVGKAGGGFWAVSSLQHPGRVFWLMRVHGPCAPVPALNGHRNPPSELRTASLPRPSGPAHPSLSRIQTSSRKAPCSRAQSWAPVRSPGCRLSSLSERRRGPQEACSQHWNEAQDCHALSSQNKGPDGSILTVALGFGRLCLSGQSRCRRHRACSLHQVLAVVSLPGRRTQARGL